MSELKVMLWKQRKQERPHRHTWRWIIDGYNWIRPIILRDRRDIIPSGVLHCPLWDEYKYRYLNHFIDDQVIGSRQSATILCDGAAGYKKEQKRPSFILHKKEEHIWIFCLTFINIMTVPTHTVCTHDMYYICRSPPGSTLCSRERRTATQYNNCRILYTIY
jgi:hypothetical protein